ncbi:MAG TPA: hypothetical protein VF521_17915, partial [Pyrinomonadaceae bacterium]
MSKIITRTRVLLLATAVAGSAAVMKVNAESSTADGAAQSAQATAPAANPLLAEWAGPHGGTPPFDKVRVADFKPALEAAMAENLAEVDKIAADKSAPTFDNTIAALERTGAALDRVTTAYGIWSSNMSSPEFQAVQAEMNPKLAAFNDKITQNEALFKRIEAVYNSPDKKRWTPEQQRLAWLYYTNFVRSGARLDAASKARLSEINQQLA